MKKVTKASLQRKYEVLIATMHVIREELKSRKYLNVNTMPEYENYKLEFLLTKYAKKAAEIRAVK